jgi:hypothetical protein
MSPNNKAAGIDCIPNEAVKACGETGVKWLHRIFTVAWNEMKVTADWQKEKHISPKNYNTNLKKQGQ